MKILAITPLLAATIVFARPSISGFTVREGPPLSFTLTVCSPTLGLLTNLQDPAILVPGKCAPSETCEPVSKVLPGIVKNLNRQEVEVLSDAQDQYRILFEAFPMAVGAKIISGFRSTRLIYLLFRSAQT